MAAAETAPGRAELPLGLKGSAMERALEEAEASGTLSLAGRRLRSFPAAAAKRWDLSDTTQADLSQNCFGEVPAVTCQLLALEGLSLSHNLLRSLPPAMANLQGLAHLDLSRNQLRSLPPCLCQLPLRVLRAAANRLTQLPDDLGALATLCQLDVGCNRLRALPAGLGRLRALRELNLSRNLLTLLPPELADLPLVHLDFSRNRISCIPCSFLRLQQLQTLATEHNPLRRPPVEVCLRGRLHIFKYLQHHSSPPRKPPRGLDSGFHSLDSDCRRWSGSESPEELWEPRRQRRRRGGAGSAPPGGSSEAQELPLQGLAPGGDREGTAEGRAAPSPQQQPERLESPQPALEPPRPLVPPPGLLAGFALFYGLVLASLLAAYRALSGG